MTPTPPVVGDQPEETDTVNDESGKLGPHLRNAVSLAAMELHQRDVAVDIARRSLDRVRGSMGDPQRSRNYGARLGEQSHAKERLAKAQELLAEYERLATSPAVGAEVRVEWGVRLLDSNGFEEDEKWFPTEAERDRSAHRGQFYGYPVETAQRCLTTSAWQPVTDEEAGA